MPGHFAGKRGFIGGDGKKAERTLGWEGELQMKNEIELGLVWD